MLPKTFNPVNKILGKKLNNISLIRKPSKNDWDGDGIINRRDCQPFNIMRQDTQTELNRLNILLPEKKSKAQELKEKQKRVDAWDFSQGRIEKPVVFAQEAGFKQLPENQKQWVKFETPSEQVIYGKRKIPDNDTIDNWILNGADDIFMQQEGVPISKIQARRRMLALRGIANKRW